MVNKGVRIIINLSCRQFTTKKDHPGIERQQGKVPVPVLKSRPYSGFLLQLSPETARLSFWHGPLRAM